MIIALTELQQAATAYSAEARRYEADRDRYEDFAAVQQRLHRAALRFEADRAAEDGKTYAQSRPVDAEPMDVRVKAALIEMQAVDVPVIEALAWRPGEEG